jgi:glycosyltransferase involved in cell wall biosynthesis
VRFLGHVGDVAPLLESVDVYLASFPHSGGHSILEAMGAGKPVVVLRYPPDSHYNSGAELVGVRELIAPGEADYIEIADRLLRNPALRQKQSQAMRDRFRAEFRPERLGERYAAFIKQFVLPG